MVEHFLGKEEVIGSIPIVGFGFFCIVIDKFMRVETGGLAALINRDGYWYYESDNSFRMFGL